MPTALVLSAAGMFGAYQAGAWNFLSQFFMPDMVVGTSAGALNGWAIAGGCTAAELSAMWLDPATAELMRPRLSLTPWRGFIDPARLESHVRDWYMRFRPRIPYAATIVEIPRLRLVSVPGERITPLHLMASCAVPFGYPPVRIDGKRYVDGGLLDVLPVWAAVEMGATRVIAVDALPVMPSRPLRAALSVVRLVGQRPTRIAGPRVVTIRPASPLGSLRDAVIWDKGRIKALIRRGESDASQIWSASQVSFGNE